MAVAIEHLTNSIQEVSQSMDLVAKRVDDSSTTTREVADAAGSLKERTTAL